ncbi:hypothetical protein X798_02042 [Onchocerca flexuosa]|uniref:Coiled-coil domain-containing protein 25 n=1 Tax=Onchocerca flexuosa TaxID=387005 RepID=A0A238C1W3_9BILA|nr:hypothetical protein X798_02042 [Onchocerca flexuosa]
MVIRFTSNVTNPPVMLYMGVDKFENENLIRWGWPEDIWFHVDKVSSAHVYARLPSGQTIDDMPETLVEDCAQLVKANSIQGNKMNNIDVVYTPWENLKKAGNMDIGQIGFKDEKKVKKKEKQRELKEAEKAEMERREIEREMRSYDNVFNEEKMHSNYDGGNDSDDFM